jgi:predicted N-acetyltransferase YhbS
MPKTEASIEPLGDHKHLIEVTAEWHWREFSKTTDLDFWIAARAREARNRGVPRAWVAFVNQEPVGTVSLIESNMDTRPDLTPWLAALYVLPQYRRQGIGRALVRRCEYEASEAGFSRLYLYARRARQWTYYRRLGWIDLSKEQYEGESILIMRRELE